MHGRFSGRLAAAVVLGASLWLTGCGNPKAEETLTGAQEVPAVTTQATGNATAELDGATLKVSGSFSGLSSDLQPVAETPAHVHKAPKGENGPVVLKLTVTAGSDNRSGTFSASGTLSDEDQEAFRDGRLYVNVHTVNNPGGELRAQLEP